VNATAKDTLRFFVLSYHLNFSLQIYLVRRSTMLLSPHVMQQSMRSITYLAFLWSLAK
jgi:hypothetical protein